MSQPVPSPISSPSSPVNLGTVGSPPTSPGPLSPSASTELTGVGSPRSPQSSVVTTLTAQTQPTTAPPKAPAPKSIWEQLRYSHSVWGSIYRLGAPPPSTRTTREVFVNDPHATHGTGPSAAGAGAADAAASGSKKGGDRFFVDNTVITSKYTVLNFVPLFLFEQFSRFANLYFLVVCVLQAIPEISITNGLPTTALPLSFVLFFDAIVTAREDYNRHRDDARANARKVLVCRDGGFKELQWRDVKVGDVLKVPGGEEIPADLVFLAASCEDPDQRGVCHVQTAQLDGETNLKMRNALDKTVSIITDDAAACSFKGKVVCEEPHENFAKFNGSLYLEANAKRAYGLDANATLLRGCVVKNVTAVYGVAVYTGRETKVRVKQSATTAKKASVEAEINRYIVALVVTQVILCVIATIGYAVWNKTYGMSAWYLSMPAISAGDVIARFFTFFLLISNIIPISLYVTMKLARTAQAFFMNSDIQCVYTDKDLVEKSNGEEGIYPLRVRSLDLNDELGQISHIFSDKTGTLTSNYMNFRKLSVNGVVYGRGSTAIGMARRRRLGLETAELELLMKEQASRPREVPHVDFIPGSETHPGRELRGPKSDLNGSGAKADPAQQEALHLFLLNCCLNHTVVLEAVQDKHTGEVKHQLSASSPDEEAFVLAAKFFGYEFVNRQKDVAIVRIHGQEQRFRIVVIIPYSSARQMMSVVVEDLQPNVSASKRFMLFSKGSDVRMFKLNVTETRASTHGEGMWLPPHLMAPVASGGAGGPTGIFSSQRTLINATKAQLMEMAEDGLRTLCFSYRPLNEDFLKPWLERYETHLSDIQQKRLKDAKLPNKIDDTASEMEKDFLFQGATANEDKLQEQVPETIALLGQAGIKIYMCTGDKQETAINIAFACRMLTNEYVRIVVTSEELLSDKILEDAAKKRKDKQEAEASALGVSSADYRELLKWQPPEPVEQVLDFNSRVKLRAYADAARAKAAKGQEFVRPRALVIDEPVMNMVWPSIPQMPKVTASTVKDVYKDTVNLIAKVQALQQALAALTAVGGAKKGAAKAYWFYDDSFTWKEGESEDALNNCNAAALAEDSEETTKLASILKAAQLPDLLNLDGSGYKHLSHSLGTILEVQKRIKAIEDELQAAADGATGISVGAGSKEEVEVLQKQAERLAADLGPQLDAAYKAAKACYLACGLSMQKDLLVIAESCRAVVCCRCRPDQKKRMLELIRFNVPTSRCLAVGDGANDVDMIQAANVGCGIIGPEGVQAANASDYALGRFRFLQRLLLVHGRWNYNRMAMLVSYMFFKNVLYAVIQYLYTLVAAWSGQKFYVEAASQTFNLIFTGLPILVAAVYDQDVSALSALTFPYLYSDGLYRRRLNMRVLAWWLSTSVYEAALIFVFTYFGAQWASMNGSSPYVFEFGSWAFTALVVVVNVRLAFNVTRHTWLFTVAWVGSLGIWFPALILFSHVQSLSDNTGGMIPYVFGSGAFWLWLLITVVATQTHNFVLTYAKRMFAPEYRELVQEYEILLTKSTEQKKGCYRACLTCGMRRDKVRKNKTADQLLALVEGLYPSSARLQQQQGGKNLDGGDESMADPAAELAKELDASSSSSSSPASVAASASASAPPAVVTSHHSPNAESPLLSNAGGRMNTPSNSSIPAPAPASSPASASAAGASTGASTGAPVAIKLVTAAATRGSSPQDYEVDFGPDLSNLDDPSHSRSAIALVLCRCKRPGKGKTSFKDSLRLVTKEDEAEELIEWPVTQQMRISLQMRRRQLYEEAKSGAGERESPEVALRKVKLDLLRARLAAVVEHGLSMASEDDEANAAAAVAEAVAVKKASPRGGAAPHHQQQHAAATATAPILVAAAAGGGAQSPTLTPAPLVLPASPGGGAGAGDGAAVAVGPLTPPGVNITATAAGVGAAGSASAAGAGGIGLARAASSSSLPPSWAILADIARVHRQYQGRNNKGTTTDFSVDDRSSAKMGEAISSVGRRINTMGRRFSSRRLTGTGGLAPTSSFNAFAPGTGRESLGVDGSSAPAPSRSSIPGVMPAVDSARSAGANNGGSGVVGVEMTTSSSGSGRPSSAPHPASSPDQYLIAPHSSPDAARTASVATPAGINIAGVSNGSPSPHPHPLSLSERVNTDPSLFGTNERRASVEGASGSGSGGSNSNSNSSS